ncbi:2-amino-4-hydroxy-6-hydroxymethyldihydropteridine diphosphokinase [Candidatus Peregrinibacteria bacterium]|nr:2-amino-4-hydroxy-6-hydroxymethyldihydropteridine diphosphokinase [Candidatus Peregrinibacteria bacterium]
MKGNEVYLSLGSNLKERQKNLKTALNLIKNFVEILKISSIYESEPVDYLKQKAFLNLVLKGKTKLSPQNLLKKTQKVEFEMGREKIIDKGPRNIDIDILFYNDEVVNKTNLIIPHPSIQKRNFVLIPLMQIEPNMLHPVLNKKINELTNNQKFTNRIKKWTKKK